MAAPRTNIREKILLVFFGLSLCLVIIEAALRMGGGVYLWVQEHEENMSAINQDAIRIVCLGESTTLLGGADSYPRQLERVLNERTQTSRFKVMNRGMAGKNTTWILSRLRDILEHDKPDIVITMMGVNDTTSTKVYREGVLARVGIFVENLRVATLFRLVYQHARAWWKERFVVGDVLNVDGDFERNLTEEITRHPKESWPYLELGRSYESLGKSQAAEHVYRRAVVSNSGKSWGYQALAELYESQGRSDDAEYILKTCLQRNNSKPWAYTYLSELYQARGRLKEAEEILRQSVARNPRKDEPYFILGRFYRQTNQCDNAFPVLQKAIDVNARHGLAYLEQGFCHVLNNKPVLAEQAFERAMYFNSGLYQRFASWHVERGDFKEAEKFLLRALKQHPDHTQVQGSLAYLYEEQGQPALAAPYIHQMREREENNYLEATRVNYQQLARRVKEHGVSLIVVQYPIRALAPLRAFFSDDVDAFVDNEGPFKQAVEEESYGAYFSDSFAGDFGHATAKGNALLAERVAEAVGQAIARSVKP